ncbi:membrane or secreted protein [Pedobacter psychrodurus]|uniref:Membrane or secreted protein n=1 Tax=Pedobacter psychrodurus TaxID=2530456 RepID=A0A4R0PTK7_9SPHI|nr:membrane or secreted protein [Pedobacter psychrodurus]TCD25045.1 membrane or secreted protein [Pedobacter psychrodurus]
MKLYINDRKSKPPLGGWGIVVFLLFATLAHAQNKQGVYVDASGVIRWEKDNKEAAFFGTNYTAPFAYGNRAIVRMGVTAEQAIKDDVYHFSRLGLDAFRVHVWDQEISDAEGNLINNEHLRLFDFLLAELKKRKIKTLVTPIAFWGNGYPEKDENTGSFVNKYGKDKSVVSEAAFKAQENYLKQFFKHKNPYTGLTYQQDVAILAAEINNEPHHNGPKERATEYVNRMTAAIKSTGWTKPIFYNISESPWYADAIVKANVQGHTFQWYPTGLVAGHTLQGNYLPNVAKYKIPFDSIPAFKNRAKAVYEFDAGDVMAPIMYPAMARSFRAAGFQWATQFAYDPMATAYANTEYQTHYLNLAYTPSKAISMLIASKVFHQTTRLDTLNNGNTFGPFKIDYKNSLSEMSTAEEFYYTNTTTSKVVNARKLKHIAGVGSSRIVQYEGRGAYFIDQLATGVWRLEVMPDAIQIRDSFEKASPKKEVTQIIWSTLPIDIDLPDLGSGFTVKGLNQGNTFNSAAVEHRFSVSPGAYLLTKKNLKSNLNAQSISQNIALGEFVAPKASTGGVFVKHQTLTTVSEDIALQINAEILGLGLKDSAFVQLNAVNRVKNIPLQKNQEYQYSATIPAELVRNGLLKYQIIVHKVNGDYITFPANVKGNPNAWDKLETESYQTYVAAKDAIVEIFNAGIDGKNINIYNPDWGNNKVEYVSEENPSVLNLKLSMNKPKTGQLMGFQSFFVDKMAGRTAELNNLKILVIKIKANTENTKIKIGLIDTDAHFFATEIQAMKGFQSIEIPLNQLKNDKQLLLPRPYPGFLPLYYQSPDRSAFSLKNAEKFEITFGYGNTTKPTNITIESIYLK